MDADYLNSYDFPIGSVIAFSGDSGVLKTETWMICDGRDLARAEYKELFKLINITWGRGDDINTFNIPDLRGVFLRGVDYGAKRDPDLKSRITKTGKVGGHIGSLQEWAIIDHSHNLNMIAKTRDWPGNSKSAIIGLNYQYAEPQSPDGNTNYVINGQTIRDQDKLTERKGKINIGQYGDYFKSGNEIRPINSYVNWIIKVK